MTDVGRSGASPAARLPDPRPIGVFDSGVGGLTVLRDIVSPLPAESTVYLGDNLRAPYGPRSDDEVRRFSLECLDELAGRDVKAIVVACNTASAVALPEMRRRYAVPILGVVRPGATAAVAATRSLRVGVIATQATVRSRAYFHAIKDENPFVEVYEHATPELVPLVEAGRLEGDDVEAVVRRSLAPLLGQRDASGEFVFPLPPTERIDTLVLGCTHYPLLAPVIEAIVGPDVAVIDSASATATALAALLAEHGLARVAREPSASTTGAAAHDPGVHVQLTTGDLASFRRMAERLFGSIFPAVDRVAVAGAA